MRITKFGHACVRLEDAGRSVVVDPGVFTDREAVEGADAVLLTHEHPDHYSADHLAACQAPVYTHAALAEQITRDRPDLAERVRVVAPGEEISVGDGPAVQAVGEWHAVIHPDLPRVHNLGYVVRSGGTSVFHPGDALTPPDQEVDVLCVVVSAPWMKVSEAVDFVRTVGAPRNLAIHDSVYSEVGLGIVDGHMERLNGPLGLAYTRLAVGQELGTGH